MTRLRFILRLNAASCLAFGAGFALFPTAIGGFLGETSALAVRLVGFGLLGNGAHLLVAAARDIPRRGDVIWFSLGDLLWGLLTAVLLASNLWITTTEGQIAAGVVGLGVSALGLAQLWQIGRAEVGMDASGYWRQIGQSWMAMPLWVKLWLFSLNAVFLAGFAFSSFARVVGIAYVAGGPLLLALVFRQGGLTRATGLGHLIAWLPLLAWLSMWLWRREGSLTEIIYCAILLGALVICLGFDLYDLRRWAKGDRAIFGLNDLILAPHISRP
jgi:hypothetical protein